MRKTTAAAALTASLLVAACGQGGQAGTVGRGSHAGRTNSAGTASTVQPVSPSSTTTAPTSPPTTAAPPTTTKPSPPDPVEAAISFFKAQEKVCNRHADKYGNPRVPSSYWNGVKPFTKVHPDPNRIVLVDGAGNNLAVDTGQRIVTGEYGPGELLPHEYEFGCPPEVFVGPAND